MKFLLAGAAALALAACVQQAPPSAPVELTGDALVVRGEYLVTGIGGCNDCHTPMTPTGPDMTQSLHGANLMFEPTVAMPWASYAPPLAGGPANYTDEQFATLLQTGVRPDGSNARPPMPQFRMNADDARAVVAYIGSLPPAAAAP